MFRNCHCKYTVGGTFTPFETKPSFQRQHEKAPTNAGVGKTVGSTSSLVEA